MSLPNETPLLASNYICLHFFLNSVHKYTQIYDSTCLLALKGVVVIERMSTAYRSPSPVWSSWTTCLDNCLMSLSSETTLSYMSIQGKLDKLSSNHIHLHLLLNGVHK